MSDVGEVCLLAFQAAQVGNGLNVLIGLLGIMRPLSRGQWQAARSVWSSYRRGREARVLLETDWQPLWALPLAQVRDYLRL